MRSNGSIQILSLALLVAALFSGPLHAANVSPTWRDDGCQQADDLEHHGPDEFSISGSISDGTADGNELGGITIWASDPNGALRQTLTEKNGKFRIHHLKAATYTVSATESGYLFSPTNQSVTITTCGVKGVAFERSLVPAGSDGLSQAFLNYLDTVPEVPVSPETTTLPDGQNMATFAASQGISTEALLEGLGFPASTPGLGESDALRQHVAAQTAAPTSLSPQEQLDFALTAMVSVAEAFANRTRWVYPAGNPASLYPAQNGHLTYIWGGKTPYSPTLPKDGCPTLTYGMDCSGLIYLVAKAAGVKTVTGQAIDQTNLANWTAPPGLTIQKVDDGTMHMGDIILWKDHDGIVATNGEIISSTGGPTQCPQNLKKGPISYPISALEKGLKSPIEVLRLMIAAPTMTTLNANPTSLPAAGGHVSMTATVEAMNATGGPAPTGTVSFVDQSGTQLCASVQLASGSATCAATLALAPDTITASYSGDANYAASSGPVTVSVTASSSLYTYVYQIVFEDVACGQTVSMSFSAASAPSGIPVSGSASYTGPDCSLAGYGDYVGPIGTGAGSDLYFTGSATSTASAPGPYASDISYCSAGVDTEQNIGGTEYSVYTSYWQGYCSSG
ncbi:MAG: Ig-like domain repeat protein, partial [Terracidiphilus sp.]